MSLSTKYRPQTYTDLVGQEVIANYLGNLSKKRIGRNILFWGPYGSSKTTSARIYSRALNCTHLKEDGSPCNECENCKAWFDEKYTDYIEYDTTKGGVDKIRDLVELAKTPPLLGNFRVILLEEVQSMSKQAWDALLKVLEEPPPFLVFLLTTTEKNKVRKAVESRCQSLETKLFNTSLSLQFLEIICETEELNYEDEALELIASYSKGHARNLLKNLEQVSFLGDITFGNVYDSFNLSKIRHTLVVSDDLFYDDSISGLDEALSDWEDSPENKWAYFLELIIFVNQFHINGNLVERGESIQFLSKDEIELLYTRIKQRYPDHDLQTNFSELIKLVSALGFPKSDLELRLHFMRLHDFVHRGSFSIKEHNTVPTSVKDGAVRKVARGRQRRTFVSTFQSSGDKEVPTPEENLEKPLEDYGLVPTTSHTKI